MLCCQQNESLGLAGACFAAAVIADKESYHLDVEQHLGGAQQLGVGPLVLLWVVHILGVFGYRALVVE